jgi:hypothetical protein
MASGEEPQDNREPAHEAEKSGASYHKPQPISTGNTDVEAGITNDKKSRYFTKFSNWVSLLTLLFVGAYTVIKFVQWRSNHIFNKKQISLINAQLSEMRSSSAQTDQTIAALKGQADIANQTLVMAQRPWLYVKGNVKYTPWGRVATEFLEAVVTNRGNAIGTNVSIVAEYRTLARELRLGSGNMKFDPSTVNCIPDLRREPSVIYRRFVAIPPQQEQTVRFIVIVTEDEFVKLVPTRMNAPYLVGCIRYDWPFTENIFDTYFQLQVTFIDVATGNQAFERIDKPQSAYRVQQVGEIEYLHAD